MQSLVNFAKAGGAPRTLAGIRAAERVLADGQWHSHMELVVAIMDTGLAEKTANNILRSGVRSKPAVWTRQNRNRPASSSPWLWHYRAW